MWSGTELAIISIQPEGLSLISSSGSFPSLIEATSICIFRFEKFISELINLIKLLTDGVYFCTYSMANLYSDKLENQEKNKSIF